MSAGRLLLLRQSSIAGLQAFLILVYIYCIWHIFWHSFWNSICYCYIFEDSLWSRSGGDHSDPGFAVRVRRGPQRSVGTTLYCYYFLLLLLFLYTIILHCFSNNYEYECYIQSLSSFPLAISGILGGPSWPALIRTTRASAPCTERSWLKPCPRRVVSLRHRGTHHRQTSTMTGESPSLEGIYHGNRRHIVYIYIQVIVLRRMIRLWDRLGW
jgi:hypothetical protein